MTNLAKELRRVMIGKNLSAKTLSTSKGLTNSLVSRLLSGSNQISDEKLNALCRAFEPGVAGGLIAAYIRDRIKGLHGSKRVQIRVDTSND